MTEGISRRSLFLQAVAAASLQLARPLHAQVPSADSRNGELPNWNSDFRMPAYRTLAEWETRAAELRRQILAAAGLQPLPARTPLNPQVFGRIERDGYSVEKVLLETLPGFYLGGNLYRPLGKSGKRPAVAFPHGHGTYGRLENTQIESLPGAAINLARQGHVVLSYDMVGYNDTVQLEHEWLGPHGLGSLREELWSFNAFGLQLWDSMRVVDFLQSLPEVDPGRIGVTGSSGGGTQTFMLSAVDPRVTAAAPVNMISAHMQGGPCESAPGLRFGTFNVEIGALIAPRPLLMVSATGDWTKNTPHEEFPEVQSIYRLYGRPELVEYVQMDAPHNYNQQSRESVYRFFSKHLLGETHPEGLREKDFKPEKPQDLLALHRRLLPASALNREQLFSQWVASARRQTEVATSAELRDRLARTLATEWPVKVRHEESGEAIVLTRDGTGERIPGIWIRGKGQGVLVVHPNGAQAGRASAEAAEHIRAGRSVLMIDSYQTGAAAAVRTQFEGIGRQARLRGDLAHRLFYVYNKTDDANRVQDILTALAFLENSGTSPLLLVGIDEAAVWCAFAAAVARARVELRADLSRFSGDDDDLIAHCFVPGIQHAGGLQAARRVIKSRA